MSGYNFQTNIVFFSEDLFDLYSVDPDEMQNNSAFHLGLHCLQVLPIQRVKNASVNEYEFGPRLARLDLDINT